MQILALHLGRFSFQICKKRVLTARLRAVVRVTGDQHKTKNSVAVVLTSLSLSLLTWKPGRVRDTKYGEARDGAWDTEDAQRVKEPPLLSTLVNESTAVLTILTGKKCNSGAEWQPEL